MSYTVLKSIHIIFVVSWFAGLFYLPRLLVYHAEAQEKGEPEKGIL
jgi:putative membrane protein